MKRFLSPLLIVGLAVIVVGAVMNQPLLMFGGFLVAVGGLAIQTATKLRSGGFDEVEQGLTPTFKSELGPLRAYRRKLTEWVAQHPDDATTKVLGAEAIFAAARIHEAAADAQRLRHKLLATNVPGARERADEAAALVQSSKTLIANLYNELVTTTADGAANETLRERLAELDALQKSLDEVQAMGV